MHFDLNLEDINIHFYKESFCPQKPTIIFLHDSFGCTTLWRDFPSKLAAATECNILIYDRQGYGKSDRMEKVERSIDYLEKEAIFLNKIIQKIDLQYVILFGHSDGGSIALLAAAKYPERIKGVITEGAHVFVEDITRKGIKNSIPGYEKGMLKSRLQKYHGNKADDVFYSWSNTWLSKEYASWNIEHFLPLIGCPVFVIQGENDEFGSIAQVYKIIIKVSGISEAFIVPSAAHSPHKECPEMIISAVENFIKNRVLFSLPL